MVTSGAAASVAASHRGFKLLKSAKNNFTLVCYTVNFRFKEVFQFKQELYFPKMKKEIKGCLI